MTQKKIDEINRQIMRWLSEDGLYKDKIHDERLHFNLVAEFPSNSGRMVNIIQPKNRDDMIVLTSGIALVEKHQKALQAMPKKEKDKLLWDVRYTLLFRESSFQMMPNPEELQNIHFSREIHYDGLNKNKLMEALRENFKCDLYIIWKFNEIFGEEPAPQPMEPMYN